jgi:hypothetical protein
MVSAGIIALGLMVVLGVLLFRDRGRERSAGSLRVGDDSTSVVQRMKAKPARCAANDLAHLSSAFPPNTPRPTVDVALGRLYGRTTTRWVYASGEHADPCRPRRGDTEVGFDRQGRVLWAVPVHGTTPIVM